VTVLRHQVRSGSYFDSIVLMRLQAALAALPGIEDAGVVMGTAANLEILAASGLLPAGLKEAADDLVITLRAADDGAAQAALQQVDGLLERRRAETGDDDYRPKSLEQALRLQPESRWVLISVPGRFAAAVAHQALDRGRNVFLYSDNVSVEQESQLKEKAAARGLLVLGPDCGTAHVGGVGFGFANRVRRGRIGLVAASGTGLQAVASRIHGLGEGISHGLGTGGRDLKEAVGGRTAEAALRLLATDPQTEALVLLSKPPAPAVAARLLTVARGLGKPVIVQLQGAPPPPQAPPGLIFASSLEDAADRAVEALRSLPAAPAVEPSSPPTAAAGSRRWLRGLFSGGTLAYEALLALRLFLQPLQANIALEGVELVTGTGPATSGGGHRILDLGEDLFTVGRLHPMIDPALRLQKLQEEAADPEVAVLLLDVVLGDGSHPSPATALAPAIRRIRDAHDVAVILILVGTDEDPQQLDSQQSQLEEAGAEVYRSLGEAMAAVLAQVPPPAFDAMGVEVPLEALAAPPTAINVGLESFHDSLVAQGATCLHMDWKPPAGGKEPLLALLERLKG
jgi:FdrA protein